MRLYRIYTQTGLTWWRVIQLWTAKPGASFHILWELLCFVFRARSHNWWFTPPFLPIVPFRYVRWRLETAYGHHIPSPRQFLYDMYYFGHWLAAYRPYVETGHLDPAKNL